MKSKPLVITAIVAAVVGLAPAAEPAARPRQGDAQGPSKARPGPLRVYLPRNVQVKTDSLRLGLISVIRGRDEKLLAKAEAVAMGRAPWRREKLIIDRRTILSRLACSGIRSDRVSFTGADKVTITRAERVFSPDELLASARAGLKRTPPGPAGCKGQLYRPVKELVVSLAGEIKLQAELAEGEKPGAGKSRAARFVSVQVAAVSKGWKLGVRQIVFKLSYPVTELLAKKNIPAGSMITPENTKMRTVMRDRPAAGKLVPPYGKIATRPLAAGTVVKANLVSVVKPVLVVKRGQNVVMRIRGVGFSVSAMGQALQDGRTGELIKVRNVDTRRIISARIAFDGTVEPVYGRTRK